MCVSGTRCATHTADAPVSSGKMWNTHPSFFLYGGAHGLAYLLDPRLIGEGLPWGNRLSLEDILFKFPVDEVPRESWDETRAQTFAVQRTSSAASERSFSTIGFLHSKLRSRLNPKDVDKLTFIKSNLPAFYDYALHDVAEDDPSGSEE
ncbi:hypothetical protein H310_08993 [Aphanomyces invadans]|uniref:HAT C-terminal dimerisation domain-containing protein n=1 Tax=Aphanomyces invadans TaxID=157072 RepID=A0A024TXC2_9STRA|nr:hypothetical protein H310_08993 [Aphanomyces invadans]ETV98281.1 hypothetical protein H310_08993 [Aphanomyces invadans]|eukprot:XP_008873156.1 hypothetical protein H310_08993 [Aphanomyces invadans]